MSGLDKVSVAISVELGSARFPLHEFLGFGRGARLPLDGADGEIVTVCANGLPVARGRLTPGADGQLRVTIEEVLDKTEDMHRLAA